MTRKSKARRTRPKKTLPEAPASPLKKFVGPAVILFAAAIAIWPLLKLGPSCGADYYFYFVSWLEAQRSMLQGIPYPHWASSANYGAGEPRFVFYPPLIWMSGAILGLIFSWHNVSVALIYLLLAATGLANRALAREVLADGPATLAGCTAIFLGNMQVDMYMRSNYAELTGGFWIPLLLLFALRNRRQSGTFWQRTFESTAPLAVVVAGIWLSNIPLGIMTAYLLVAIALASSLLQKSWAPLARAVLAFALGLCLAGFYLLPAIWERNWTNFHNAMATREYRIENGWLFSSHADSISSRYSNMLEIHSLSAVAIFAVTMVALFIAWKRHTLPVDWRWWSPLALLAPVVLFFQLPVSLPVWNALPQLRLLQFPWRWLLLMQPPMAGFFACAVWTQTRRIRIPLLTGCSVLFFLLMGATLGNCRSECGAPVAEAITRVQNGQVAGKPEYAPPGIQHALVEPDSPQNCEVKDLTDLSAQPAQNVMRATGGEHLCDGSFTQAINRPEHKAFNGLADHAGYLILNLRSYPAWAVAVNGRLTPTISEPIYGLAAVPVPQGLVVVTANWTTTPDVWAGRGLSALAVALLTMLCALERRRARGRLSLDECPPMSNR